MNADFLNNHHVSPIVALAISRHNVNQLNFRIISQSSEPEPEPEPEDDHCGM